MSEIADKFKRAYEVAKWSRRDDDSPIASGMAWTHNGEKEWLTWGDINTLVTGWNAMVAENERLQQDITCIFEVKPHAP